MQKFVESLFQKFGTPVQLHRGSQSWDTKVFFQADRSKSLRNLQAVFSPLGQVPRGQRICWFPASILPVPGDTVVSDRERFCVCQAEPMLGLRGQLIYRWALCRKMGGEDL